jgi:hypothetical protein
LSRLAIAVRRLHHDDLILSIGQRHGLLEGRCGMCVLLLLGQCLALIVDLPLIGPRQKTENTSLLARPLWRFTLMCSLTMKLEFRYFALGQCHQA